MQVRANYSYIDKFTGWTNCGNTAGSYSGSVIFAQNRSLLEAAHRSNAFYPGRSLPIRKFYALPIARPGDFFCDLYNNQKKIITFTPLWFLPGMPDRMKRESGENPEQYSLL